MSLLPAHGISEHLLHHSNTRASRAKTTPVVSSNEIIIGKLNLLVVANVRFSFSFVILIYIDAELLHFLSYIYFVLIFGILSNLDRGPQVY